MSKLTPEQKEDKQQRDSFLQLSNKIRSAFSFGKIKTFRELLYQTGYSILDQKEKNYREEELDRLITFYDIKEYLADLHCSLEAQIFLKRNPPDLSDLRPDGNITVEQFTKIVDDALDNTTLLIDPNYGLTESLKESAFLFWFQKKAIAETLYKILIEKKRGLGIVAATGTGKTFIAGGIFRRLLDCNFSESKTFSPFPYIYVTKASVIEQTKRVLNKFFGIDTINEVLVINYDQLRSKFGELFVKEEVEVIKGEDSFVWKWRPNINPVFILWDEFHSLKNDGSQQSQIGASYNDIDSPHTHQVFMSATPFTRVAEAKCFSVSTRIPFSFGGITKPLCNATWKYFAQMVAAPAEPEEYNPSAVDRLMDKLDDYIVRVRGVKSQFHAENKVKVINFQTKQGQDFYNSAWQKFMEKKAKIEGEESLNASQSKFQILAQLTIFRIAAESNPDRVEWIAKYMYDLVNAHKRAAVCALNFKISIIKIVRILIEKYKVPRQQIALIWGGGQTVNKKQKLKYDIEENKELLAMLEAEGITMQDLDLDDIEAKNAEDVPEEYKLGIQSLKQRQVEIDRFQSGKALYCFYTLRAGGVGLSLHHTDELTTQKVKHKESGYAVEEDIHSIPTRQRETLVAPTYSAIELVQGLGRVPRLTSLSNTIQTLLFFAGTIEERVARIVSVKLKCLSKVVRQKEAWDTVIIGGNPDAEEKKFLGNSIPDKEDQEGELIQEGEEEK